MRLVFLGPPGVGKGTQADRVCARYGYPHIATGDILRAAVKNRTPVGLEAKEYMDSGRLVPDGVVVRLMKERLVEPDCSGGFLLDGFPRTLEQARALEQCLSELGVALDAVVYFCCGREVVVNRISGRRTCRDCGAMYHVTSLPPKQAERCDRCQGTLFQRSDDQESVVMERLNVYERQTAPLIGYYKKSGRGGDLLHEISGGGSPDEVYREIEKTLGSVNRSCCN